MPNQRRRRPLQDEGRKDKKDFRQRSEQSRTQRDRIQTHRERRETRRDRQRSRRQQVDSVRSPKEDLRTERWDSRLLPVEDSFLARPVGTPPELPVVIGERWGMDTTNGLASGVEETLVWDTAVFTTERNGYPALYDGAGTFRVPSGLAGIWGITAAVKWSVASDVTAIVKIRLNATSIIAQKQEVTHSTHSTFLSTVYILQEADTIDVRVLAGSVGNVDGDPNETFIIFEFMGK